MQRRSSLSGGQITAGKLQEGKLMAYQERGLMEIELCAEDILRVRFNPQGDFRPRRSWDIVEAL